MTFASKHQLKSIISGINNTNVFKLLIIFITITLYSCSSDDAKVINSDQPSVTIIKKVYLEAKDEENGFSWPEFSSPNKTLEKMLNDSLSMKNIIGLTYQEIEKEYDASVKDFGMPQGIVGLSYKVNMNDGFMLDINFYDVSLGAHFDYGEYHKKINLKTGEEISLEELVNEENYPEIIKICKTQAQKKANDYIIETKANDGVDLTEFYGKIEFDKSDLEKFTITPTGIYFSVNAPIEDYMRAYELELGSFLSFKEYGYIAKKGSLLEEYITNNKNIINDYQQNSTNSENYETVNTKEEFINALKNVAGNTQIVIESDIASKTPIIVSRSNITISGDLSIGTMLSINDPEETVLVLENCEDVTIKNLKLRHLTGGESCSSSVISLHNCKNITISNCDISGCGAYGIRVAEDCSNINITNNKIYDCSLSGIEFYGKDSRITGNTFYHNGDGQDDHYIEDENRSSVVLEYNKYYKWNKDILVKEIDDYLKTARPIERSFSNNWGSGSIKAFYRYDEIVYMDIVWNEIDAFNMKAYYARQMPQYVSWSIDLGDSDAPDGDYEMDSDYYHYTATFEGYKLVASTKQFREEKENLITDKHQLDSIRGNITIYLYKWENVISKKKDVKDVFTDMPILY